MNKYLVTGCNGFVGKELINHLKNNNKKFIGIDQNVQEGDNSIQVDITDSNDLNKALCNEPVDYIIHLASASRDIGNDTQMVKINLNGLQNLLEYALKLKAKRFVLASSTSSYGYYPSTKFETPEYMPVNEKHICRPKNIYSTTKLMQELLTLNYYYQHNLPVAILRFTAVVGPAGSGGGLIWMDFARNLAEGKKIQIPHFSPEELNHYVDIRDVARMLITASENNNAVGEIFNCCGPKPTRGYEFEKIIKEISPGIEVEYGYPWSPTQGKEIAFDMSKALSMLDFKPQYTLEDSIKYIKEWIDSINIEEFKKNEKYSFIEGLNKIN
jgi:nucleoside-diphosphate-sugar epimerase